MWDSDRRRRRRRQLFRDADGSQEALRDYRDVLGLKKKEEKKSLLAGVLEKRWVGFARLAKVSKVAVADPQVIPSGCLIYFFFAMIICHLFGAGCGSVACVRPHERVTGGRGQRSKSFCDKDFTCLWLNLIRLSSFMLY